MGVKTQCGDLPGDHLLSRARLSRSPPGRLRPGGISSLVTSRAGTCPRGRPDAPHHMCCGPLGTRGVQQITSGLPIQNGTLPFGSRLSKRAPPTPRPSTQPRLHSPDQRCGCSRPPWWHAAAVLLMAASCQGLTLIASFSFPVYPYNHVWIGGRPILQVERRD